MLEQGKSEAEIIGSLSNPDFYTKEFLCSKVDWTLAELARRELESEIDIRASEFIKRNYQRHHLFYTQ